MHFRRKAHGNSKCADMYEIQKYVFIHVYNKITDLIILSYSIVMFCYDVFTEIECHYMNNWHEPNTGAIQWLQVKVVSDTKSRSFMTLIVINFVKISQMAKHEWSDDRFILHEIY